MKRIVHNCNLLLNREAQHEKSRKPVHFWKFPSIFFPFASKNFPTVEINEIVWLRAKNKEKTLWQTESGVAPTVGSNVATAWSNGFFVVVTSWNFDWERSFLQRINAWNLGFLEIHQFSIYHNKRFVYKQSTWKSGAKIRSECCILVRIVEPYMHAHRNMLVFVPFTSHITHNCLLK